MLRRLLNGRFAHGLMALVFLLTLFQGAAGAGRAILPAFAIQGGSLSADLPADGLRPALKSIPALLDAPSNRLQAGPKRLTAGGGRDDGPDPLLLVLLAVAAAILLPRLGRTGVVRPLPMVGSGALRPHLDGSCPTGPPVPAGA